MISTSDFKNGMSIIYDGKIFLILEFMHVKPGKGGAFVRTKLKDMRTGGVIDKTFTAGEKMEQAIIDKETLQYLYNDGLNYVFMNNETFEQIEIPLDKIEYERKFIKEGMNVDVIKCQGELLGVNLPDKVTLRIVECDPAVAGNTKTNALKDATLETGLLIKVPLFVENGEEVVVSTVTGKYDSRA